MSIQVLLKHFSKSEDENEIYRYYIGAKLLHCMKNSEQIEYFKKLIPTFLNLMKDDLFRKELSQYGKLEDYEMYLNNF